MKKFTNISGAKVGIENEVPRLSEHDIELNELKHSIMKLMDDFLSIRSYGVARPEIMIPTRIVGKEMFVEALTDLISQKESKKIIKALESLKTENKDWKSIEDKIDSIKVEDRDIMSEKSIMDILEKYGSDEDNLVNFLDITLPKITSHQAFRKHLIAESMIKNVKNSLIKVLSSKYLERSKSL